MRFLFARQGVKMINKNDETNIYIDGMGYDGEGVGRIGGIPVFVPYAAKGDTALVKIVKKTKSHMFGKLIRVTKPSDDRAETVPCPVYGKCGGCSLMHLKYESQLEFKRERVKDCMKKIFRNGEINVLPVIPCENRFFYRNKIQLPIGTDKNGAIISGFYAPHSHRIVQGDRCMLQNENLRSAVTVFLSWMRENGISAYNEETSKGLVRHLFVRCGEYNGKTELVVMPVINGNSVPNEDALKDEMIKQGVTTLCLNINTKNSNVILGEKTVTLYGSGYIKDVLLGKTFKISPQSFYQVNRPQAEILYRTAINMAGITKDDIVYDLYCGAGTITLCAADYAKHVYGIEMVESAVKNAEENAEMNGIKNVTFFAGDVAEIVRKLRKTAVPDTVILDPPRKGCTVETLELLAEICPKKIVYVSCNPATLARDMAYLSERGYFAGDVQPVDMFPQTAHVETVCLLVRRNVLHINIDVDVEEMLQNKRGQATYSQIKEYVLQNFSLKVSQLNIAQVKRKYGIIERENYNKPKSVDSKQPNCTKEKEDAITEALKHFGMIK